MNPAEQARFDKILDAMTQAMQLHGLRDKTIDSYRRTLYRIAGHFGRCPDDLQPDELKDYFSALLEQYSWSTIKVDLSSLQFFHRYVLEREMEWIKIIRPPRWVTDRVQPSDNQDELIAMGRDRLMIWGARNDTLFGLVDLMEGAWAGDYPSGRLQDADTVFGSGGRLGFAHFLATGGGTQIGHGNSVLLHLALDVGDHGRQLVFAGLLGLCHQGLGLRHQFGIRCHWVSFLYVDRNIAASQRRSVILIPIKCS